MCCRREKCGSLTDLGVLRSTPARRTRYSIGDPAGRSSFVSDHSHYKRTWPAPGGIHHFRPRTRPRPGEGGSVCQLVLQPNRSSRRVVQKRVQPSMKFAALSPRPLFRRGIISSLQMADVCEEYEQPRHDDFRLRTAWSLFNAFTEVLRYRAITSPQTFVAATIRLNGLMLATPTVGREVPTLAA